jgi:hypothetical protein
MDQREKSSEENKQGKAAVNNRVQVESKNIELQIYKRNNKFSHGLLSRMVGRGKESVPRGGAKARKINLIRIHRNTPTGTQKKKDRRLTYHIAHKGAQHL